MRKEKTMNCELRPCIVKDRKALFHSWQRSVDYIPPLIDKHLGGVTEYIIGVIERENGTIELVSPDEIRFIDNKVESYFEKMQLSDRNKNEMSYIVPMEMPKTCNECPFLARAEELDIGNGTYKKICRCIIAPEECEDPYQDVHWLTNNKNEWCPLKEVKTDEQITKQVKGE